MARSVVHQCKRASRLADLISGAGRLTVAVTGRRVVITRGAAVLADVDDSDLAVFAGAAPSWLRTLAEAVATAYTEHTPARRGGRCPHCGTPDPCHTRRLLDVRILRGPADDGTDSSDQPVIDQ